MDQEVVNSLGKLKLTKEEEEDIVITNINSSEIFEECSFFELIWVSTFRSSSKSKSFKEHFKGIMEDGF